MDVYIIGEKVLEDKGHFGVKKNGDLNTPVRGLISATISVEPAHERKNYSSFRSVINEHLKTELLIDRFTYSKDT